MARIWSTEGVLRSPRSKRSLAVGNRRWVVNASVSEKESDAILPSSDDDLHLC